MLQNVSLILLMIIPLTLAEWELIYTVIADTIKPFLEMMGVKYDA
jgi:hypothetical protein